VDGTGSGSVQWRALVLAVLNLRGLLRNKFGVGDVERFVALLW
jgi:hypothetical protein